MNKSNDLISIIKSNYYKFSKGQKLIAQFLIDHYDKAAFMTAAKIGETVDVSESTVVRFASSIGYSGFPELQRALQILIKNKLTTVQRINLEDDIGKDSVKLHRKIIKNEINNMRSLYETIDPKALDKATDTIMNANRVYILGLRTSSTLSNYLGFYLDVILDNVKVLNNTGVNSLYEEIIRIKETDVLIVISYPRYSKITVSVTEFVKERNAKIEIYSFGKKSSEFFNKQKEISLYGTNDEIWDNFSFENVSAIGNKLMQEYKNKRFDRVEIIYNQFKNSATQILTNEIFLPVQVKSKENNKSNNDKIIFEPSFDEVKNNIIPQSLRNQIYKCFLDSFASEHGARMTAMHLATDNAQNLLKDLKLSYNKARQAAITNEIIEISSGAEALNE